MPKAQEITVLNAASLTLETRSFQQLLDAELAALRDLLLAKNASYGNSALDPLRIFSSANSAEQLRVRIDDKISRLMRGRSTGGLTSEDTVTDLLGYLVLLKIAERQS